MCRQHSQRRDQDPLRLFRWSPKELPDKLARDAAQFLHGLMHPPPRVGLALVQLELARVQVSDDTDVASVIQRDPKLAIGDAARKDFEGREILRDVTEKFVTRSGTVLVEQRAPGADFTGLLERDIDIRVIQVLLGHAMLATAGPTQP